MNGFLGLLLALALASVASASSIEPRMKYGSAVDTLRRFPHHVSIEPIYEILNLGETLCGGSIIHKNWILTSSRCVGGSERLKLNIQKLFKNDTSGSFTIVINNDPDNVIIYPTEYDDVALVRLPVDLIFSPTLQPIPVSRVASDRFQNKLAVLPGFDTNFVPTTPSPSALNSTSVSSIYQPIKNVLTYAMLSILSNKDCQSTYGAKYFDEYLHICTRGWGNFHNVPCWVDDGSGLVVGWPASPKLIGVYSPMSYDCNSGGPSRFINLEKYSSWIDDVIGSY